MNASNKKKSTKKRKKLVHENQLIQINAKKILGNMKEIIIIKHYSRNNGIKFKNTQVDLVST